jgi:uncharacterized protein
VNQRVSLITLGVNDLGRARRFYEKLGWQTGAAPDDDVVFFQTGEMVVALWDRTRLAEDSCVKDDGGWGGITLALNLGSPTGVDATIEEARAAGATIGREPAETFWGGLQRRLPRPRRTSLGGRSQPPLDDHRGRRRQAELTLRPPDWPISQRPFHIASRADFHLWRRRTQTDGTS